MSCFHLSHQICRFVTNSRAELHRSTKYNEDAKNRASERTGARWRRMETGPLQCITFIVMVGFSTKRSECASRVQCNFVTLLLLLFIDGFSLFLMLFLPLSFCLCVSLSFSFFFLSFFLCVSLRCLRLFANNSFTVLTQEHGTHRNHFVSFTVYLTLVFSMLFNVLWSF